MVGDFSTSKHSTKNNLTQDLDLKTSYSYSVCVLYLISIMSRLDKSRHQWRRKCTTATIFTEYRDTIATFIMEGFPSYSWTPHYIITYSSRNSHAVFVRRNICRMQYVRTLLPNLFQTYLRFSHTNNTIVQTTI